MIYNKTYISNKSYDELVESMNKYYYDYNLISVIYNNDSKRYIAFLERKNK